VDDGAVTHPPEQDEFVDFFDGEEPAGRKKALGPKAVGVLGTVVDENFNHAARGDGLSEQMFEPIDSDPAFDVVVDVVLKLQVFRVCVGRVPHQFAGMDERVLVGHSPSRRVEVVKVLKRYFDVPLKPVFRHPLIHGLHLFNRKQFHSFLSF
jgi:hypothetical protein